MEPVDRRQTDRAGRMSCSVTTSSSSRASMSDGPSSRIKSPSRLRSRSHAGEHRRRLDVGAAERHVLEARRSARGPRAIAARIVRRRRCATRTRAARRARRRAARPRDRPWAAARRSSAASARRPSCACRVHDLVEHGAILGRISPATTSSRPSTKARNISTRRAVPRRGPRARDRPTRVCEPEDARERPLRLPRLLEAAERADVEAAIGRQPLRHGQTRDGLRGSSLRNPTRGRCRRFRLCGGRSSRICARLEQRRRRAPSRSP